jgi:hypothetical protein
MMTAMFCIITLGLACVVYGFWGLACNARTSRKRQGLLAHIVPGTPEFDARMADFKTNCGYEQHMRALIFFRDPKGLYGPLMRGIWDEKP